MDVRNATLDNVSYTIRPAADAFRDAVVALLEEQVRQALPTCCAGAYLSLLVRVPDEPEADLVVTADAYPELLALLRRSASREGVAAEPHQHAVQITFRKHAAAISWPSFPGVCNSGSLTVYTEDPLAEGPEAKIATHETLRDLARLIEAGLSCVSVIAPAEELPMTSDPVDDCAGGLP